MTRGPVIAIVGRPNVGKSTLFNRLIGSRKAVVSSLRGTTRDRLYGRVTWRGMPLTLIDTGGCEPLDSVRGSSRAASRDDLKATDRLIQSVQRHVQSAIGEADLLLFVCDAQDGVVPADLMIMETLRKANKPLVVAVNKVDSGLAVPTECFAFGATDTLAVSALHGRGTGDLLDRLVQRAGQWLEAPGRAGSGGAGREQPPAMSLAILGRQNVGKSSLLNALLRTERVIVSEIPGTTRDAVDTSLVVGGEPVSLIDTAGLRHRRKVKSPVDLFSMARAIEAMRRCDVALVVLDATQGVTQDDRRIINAVCEEGCGLVLVANKWDLIKGGRERALQDTVHRAMPSAFFAPVVATAATTGFHVARALTTALGVARRIRRGLPETACETLLRQAWEAQPPPRWRGRALRLAGARWLPGRPVPIELTIRPVGWLSVPYQRYLLKWVYKDSRLSGIPIRWRLLGPDPS